MGKSLLDMIGENERARIVNKNLPIPTDDVEKSDSKEGLNSFGVFAGINYSKDVNKESMDVSTVGDKALQDLKELNVFPQDNYVRISTDLNDASVIDMPEIDEISKDIYLNAIRYNKYASKDYTPYEHTILQGVLKQFTNYAENMVSIVNKQKNGGTNIIDVFTGNFDENDSQLGQIGSKALQSAIQVQIAENLKRETFIGTSIPSLANFSNNSFNRTDYDITVPSNTTAKTFDFLGEIAGLTLPISYLPKDLFGFERTTLVDSNGRVTYIGSSLTLEQRMSLLAQYTGKGQVQQLINAFKTNIYKYELTTDIETIYGNPYVNSNGNQLIATDFIVNLSTSEDTGSGYYEPYGVVSIHKTSSVGKMFSDQFQWTWNEDVTNKTAVGWTKNAFVPTVGNIPVENKFNPKTLLFKTQEIVSNNPNVFIDLNSKEFVENINGESRIISRGDATTASGAYIDDDGTPIAAGEYFRVWTKARGYNRLDRTLRHRGLDNGDKRSVLNDNGLINFAPTKRSSQPSDDIIKRYMFSIENLAWNDHMNDLPECEQGVGDPVTGTRGRIMWFPPYDLLITESVVANWKETEFIGRGEPIFTYNNSKRSATLKFKIIVDHPDIVHKLVGEKSEFWERYFKGDKLVQEQAQQMLKSSKNLSQNEMDEIEKRRKLLQPIEKKVDGDIITDNKKDENTAEENKEKTNNFDIGETVLQVYFPNAVTTIPQSSLLGQTGNLSARTDLTFNDLKKYNIGYEDGKVNDGYQVITSDGYSLKTSEGIKYIKNGVVVNKGFTYLDSKLVDSSPVCKETGVKNIPSGYHDGNNNGLNKSFYFDWEKTFNDLFPNTVKKVQMSFIGNASAAKPTGKSNSKLSQERGLNVEAWFKKNVAPKYPNIEFVYNTSYLSDTEDNNKIDAGQIACQDCDRADAIQCKQTRRVDIKAKILAEDEEPTEIVTPPTGGTTINEVIDDGTVDLDDDQTTELPNDTTEFPPIDPEILKKLVYTECDFFNYLEVNQPLAYQTISERIKYFHPAYHSMTPQGFNSRLTFLHQCLRQGDSIGRDGIDNWKNLAFGRPPVCILRIGDFYHTRIIIESMSLSYDKMTWDLNPEGIGVQPMFIDVSLEIKIIGGSSMTAPINRLQNALSFNYYANTEMYDGRADSVVFKDLGNDSSTFGKLKNGKIINGIKLSSLVNNSKSKEESNLAKLRQQSRITLPNSTTANANIENTGQVEGLLEMKKRLNLPMTEQEKIDMKAKDATKGKFSTTEINPITVSEVKNSSTLNLQQENSVLNQKAKELLLNNGQTDEEVFKNIYGQFMSAQVTNPNTLTTEYLDNSALEYIQAYDETWRNVDGTFITM